MYSWRSEWRFNPTLDLPEDREIIDELLRDPELKPIARQVDGRMLAVASKDQRKFFLTEQT